MTFTSGPNGSRVTVAAVCAVCVTGRGVAHPRDKPRRIARVAHQQVRGIGKARIALGVVIGRLGDGRVQRLPIW